MTSVTYRWILTLRGVLGREAGLSKMEEYRGNKA